MTPKRDEIRARHELQSQWPQVMDADTDYPGSRRVACQIHKDRAALLAQLDRAEALAECLHKAQTYLRHDRDCLRESVSTADGTIPDPYDRVELEEIEALLANTDAALKQWEQSND